MKIIIDPDMAKELFNSEYPTVSEILENKVIKRMVSNSKVMGVFKDDITSTDMDSIVIKVIPLLKGSAKNGK